MKNRKSRKQISTFESLFRHTLSALNEAFPGDRWTPGIEVAHIPNSGMFYVALHRYPVALNQYPGGPERVVLSKGSAETPEAALTIAAGLWVGTLEKRNVLVRSVATRLCKGAEEKETGN